MTFACLSCVFLTVAPAGFAQTKADPLMFFADCAGRSVAELHYETFNANGPTDRTRTRRAQFRDLLTAIAPKEGPEFDAMWRQRKRSQDAQERLRIQADYHVDRQHAARAAAEARRQLALCDAALLG